MNLVATKLIEYKDKQGQIWYKGWHLKDADTKKIYGMLVYNSHWTNGKLFGASVFNPVHSELGYIASEVFAIKEEALVWARAQIEQLSAPILEDYEDALQLIKDARYRSEMSDDFAYTNGTLARWDRIEQEVRTAMGVLT